MKALPVKGYRLLNPKDTVKERPEFELIYNEVIVQHAIYYTTETPLQIVWLAFFV